MSEAGWQVRQSFSVKGTAIDIYSPEKRSEVMSRVRSRDTKPEILVRSLLHRAGYRFRLGRTNLPGSPDLVMPKYRAVVFVHGCFWHQHPGCSKATTPTTRREWWSAKLTRNVERDKEVRLQLIELGWLPITVWECELRDPEGLERRFKQLLSR